MRILVCGGRNYRDPDAVYSALDYYSPTCVIEGGASGADCYAAEWADKTGTPHIQFNAKWEKYGKSAGPIRNREMVVKGRPDLVIAFPGGRGTENLIKVANSYGVKVIRLPHDE